MAYKDHLPTFKELADLVKERINCFEYAQDEGIDLKPNGNTYRSTSPIMGGSNDTCFMIYKDNLDFFIDWNADKQGDVIELAAQLNHNGDRGAALKELIKKTGINWIGDHNTSDINNYTNGLNEKILYWHDTLLNNGECLEYLHSRNITDKTITNLKLGYSENRHRIMIPYYHNGRPVYYAGRIFPSSNYTPTEKDSKYQKAKIDGYNQHICWGTPTLNRETPLIIAEGAFDAISFEQEGYAVLSPLGGHFNKDQLKTVFAAARSPKHKETIVIFDTDTAGMGFTRKLATELFKAKIPFKTATVPDAKDVSEYYEKHKELQGILETATDGLVFLCSTFKDDKDGLSSFILKAARYISAPDMAELFSELRHLRLFNSDWLKELEKQCRKSPAETLIVKEITKKGHLLFTEDSGFYEYDGVIWKKQDDTAIKKVISKAMGRFATGGKINSVFNLLAADCHTTQEFNKKRLMTFKNGTLELDTGTFRKPRYNDYISILLPYDYDPAATAPTWEKFINEVTAGEKDKAMLLQEIAGYCLFPKNSMQKCANLIGDGGNGKSVYVDTLRELFGTENVSAVSISDLDNQFSRIYLKDSLINLCTEVDPKITHNDGIFKNLTAGDPIDGCYKRKNSVFFTPRAKLIVASNNFIVFPDHTDAIIRRMLFIKFTEKFLTDRDPQFKHEHKADIFLTDKLKKELSGIFNWVLEGYRRLMQNKRFTHTAESDAIRQSYLETINPLFLFINSNDELFSRDTFYTPDLYDNYKYWAMDNGFGLMNSRTFSRKFNAAFEKTYPNWHKDHGRKGTQWIKDREITPPVEIDKDFTEIE